MNAERKFNSYVIGITTIIMFSLWALTSDVITKYRLISVLLGGLISIGTYRSIYFFLQKIFDNAYCFRRFILGAGYMEGIWIGFFIGHKEKVRFFVENFEQDLNSLVIRGKSFDENGKFHGSWISDTTYVNVKKGKLTYYYEADVVSNSYINPGLASFEFNRISQSKPPVSMLGYSSDLFSNKKLKAYEQKITGKVEMNLDAITQKAIAIYEANKGRV